MTYRELFFTTFGETPRTSHIWQAIHKAYTEPHRVFHILQHLNEHAAVALKLFAKYPHIFTPNVRRKYVATIGGHDIVYAIGQPHGWNENSSVHATDTLFAPIMDEAELVEVEELILATTNHKPGPELTWQNLFLLADLSVLASSADRYFQYAHQILQEYTGVEYDDIVRGNVPPDKREGVIAYLKGRRAWLNKQSPEATEALFKNWPFAEGRPFSHMSWELVSFLPGLERAMGLDPTT